MKKLTALLLALAMLLSLTACEKEYVEVAVGVAVPIAIALLEDTVVEPETPPEEVPLGAFSLDAIPDFSGEPYISINGNTPFFIEAEWTTTSYEYYSDLDHLGRCGMTAACVGTDLMPEEDRGEIGSVKPTGWQSVKYDVIEGKYLYNRCHLIGFQLTGENANYNNLITGTRYLNIEGMLPFENMVADYVRETGNHVLYRVTPIFRDEELVARGVLMEGFSVEDMGEGICFCVFAYNSQPWIAIDYATGESQLIQQEE